SLEVGTAADQPLILAFTPSRDPVALQEAGDEFAKTVTRMSGVPIRAQVASDYAGVVEALRSRRVDLAFVHPVGYVLANREAGCQILVRDVWQGKTAYTARFYVRKGSGIERVEDLRGKSVAFVDPASSSGYIYPMVLLIKKGLVRDRDPKTFFKEALFAGTHEAALQSVVHGRVDAAASFDKAPEIHLKDPALIDRPPFVGETPEQVARPGAELGLDMTQRAHDDRSGRPPRRARRALQSQALGEGHRRVIPAMDQEERGAEPTEVVLGRERGQELADAGWKLGHE